MFFLFSFSPYYNKDYLSTVVESTSTAFEVIWNRLQGISVTFHPSYVFIIVLHTVLHTSTKSL